MSLPHLLSTEARAACKRTVRTAMEDKAKAADDTRACEAK